jgi:hypothetical protein
MLMLVTMTDMHILTFPWWWECSVDHCDNNAGIGDNDNNDEDDIGDNDDEDDDDDDESDQCNDDDDDND